MSTLPFRGRRRFLQLGSTALTGAVLPGWAAAQGAPALISAEGSRPRALQGVQFGDPTEGSVLVWSRSDRPARMLVEWSLDRNFHQAHKLFGPYALQEGDFTVRQDLDGLPGDREVFVRVSFQALDSARSGPVAD